MTPSAPVIRSIDVFECRIPLDKPFDLGPHIHIANREYTVVRLTTSEGATGTAYCLSRNADLVSVIRRNIGPTYLGQPVHEVERLWQLAYDRNLLPGQRGILARALGLADTAAWDAKAQTAGLPLWQLLGGFRGHVPSTIVVAYPFADQTHERIRAEIEEALTFRPLGVKLSSCSDYAEDTQRMALAREVVGPEVEVMMDLHFDWRDAKTARRWLREWEALDLAWVEDPFPPEMIQQAADLRANTDIPIAIGDDQSSKQQIRTLIEAGAVDIVRLDVAALGGITEFRKVAALADAHGLRLASHVYVPMHAHCLASITNAYCVEWIRPESGIENIERLWLDSWPFEDGGFALPDEPGLGIHWDWEAVAHYQVGHWRGEA